MIGEQPQGAILRLGKVVKVHPSDHSVDLVMMDNGAKLANVQVLSPTASTRSGRVDLPEPDIEDQSNPWSLQMSKKQDLLAAVAMMAGTPICIGFLYPQVNELAMPEGTKNLAIERHASDFYSTITDSATMTMHHPGGSYFSMGGNYNDFTKKDFDKKWEIKRNIREITTTIYNPTTKDDAKQSSGLISCNSKIISLESKGDKGGATLHLSTDGFIRAEATESIVAHAENAIDLIADVNIHATAESNIDAEAGSSITITAGESITEKAGVIYLN